MSAWVSWEEWELWSCSAGSAAPPCAHGAGQRDFSSPHGPGPGCAQFAGRPWSACTSTDHHCSAHRHLHNNRIQSLGANGFEGLHSLETL